MIDVQLFVAGTRESFRIIEEIIDKYETKSFPDSHEELCDVYTKSVREFMSPLRGYVIAVENKKARDVFLPINLLHDYIDDISRWEARYELPYISKNISKPITGIDDEEAYSFVLTHYRKAALTPEPEDESNIVVGFFSGAAPATKPAVERSEALFVELNAACVTPYEHFGKELARRLGAFWDEADAKYKED